MDKKLSVFINNIQKSLPNQTKTQISDVFQCKSKSFFEAKKINITNNKNNLSESENSFQEDIYTKIRKRILN